MVIAEDKSLSVERVLGKWKERELRSIDANDSQIRVRIISN